MTTLVKAAISQAFGQALLDDISEQRNKYYYALGRAQPWPDESIIPTNVDTEKYEISVRDDILLLKNVDSNSLSFLVDRIDYVSGTIYAKYDDDISQIGQNYYVLTSDFNVYKCIYNNEGLPSTVEPYGTPIEFINLSDGYVWKYVYSLPPALRNKFLTAESMPIYNSITSEYYSRGSLNKFIISNAGSGYTQALTSIQVSGDGYLEDNKEKLTSFILKSKGSGYTTIPNVDISNPFTNSQLWNPTSSYILGQTLLVNDGNIRFYRVTTSGISSTLPPTHYYSESQNGTLALKHIGTKPSISSTIDATGVGSILITDSGEGYTSPPTLTKTGLGSGLIMNPVLVGDQLTNVEIVNTGTGYTTTGVTVTPPFLTSTTYSINTLYPINTILKLGTAYYRTATPGTTGPTVPSHTSGTVLNGTTLLQYIGRDAIVSAVLGVVASTSTSGDIGNVRIISGGTNYANSGTSISFVGGSPTVPATGNVIVVGGVITEVIITFPGIGYQSNPTISVSGTGTGANLLSVLQFGYGYNNIPNIVFDPSGNVNGVLPVAEVTTTKTEASLEPIIVSGKLRGIRVADGGVGYTEAVITIVGDGTEAALSPLFVSGDIITPQTRNELFAIPGQLSSVTITNPGNSITSISVSIIGDGVGAVVQPVVVNGQLSQLKVINPGSGYTKVNFNIITNITATAPVVKSVLSPVKGHGSNPINELKSKSIALFTKFTNDTNNNIDSENTYRQVSILKNPLKYNSDDLAISKKLSACYVVSTNSNISLITPGTELTSANNTKYRVVEKSGENLLLQSEQNSLLTISSSLSTVISSTTVNVIIKSISFPNVDKYSGDILYIDNLLAFKPTIEQQVSINTIIDLI